MALWGNNENSQDDKWKNKYLNLLDKQEVIEQQIHENEELLCKTVQRLTLAAKGFNKQLDPCLNSIHKTVKSGLKAQHLKEELENFTQAVLQINDEEVVSGNPEPVTILFDFLMRQHPNQQNTSRLTFVKSQHGNNVFKSQDEFFLALLEAIESEPTPSSLISTEPHLAENQIDADTVTHQLLLLLENLEIPFDFEEQAESLKTRLKNHPSAKTFEPLLDEYVSLLVNLKKHIQSEQKDIETFLSQITEQLTELGLQASGASAVTKQSDLDRIKLDQYVSDQVKDLQSTSAKATTLEPLKQLINSRLDSIAQQIHLHRQKEEDHRLKTQLQLDKLGSKINTMEHESAELKSKLVMAHDKALRDPLTGLPNRVAYDERLDAELSRWQRYGSPLSLIVWDIDHFKNINDNYGHKAGDKTLKIISQLLNDNCRHLDFLSRFGGEEFTMLLPSTDKTSALTLAEKLRLIIEKSKFNANGQSLSITISCGISEFQDGDTPEIVFERADAALYEAKNSGRNKCLVS